MIEKMYQQKLNYNNIPNEDYDRDSRREKLLIEQELIQELRRDTKRGNKFENDITKLEFNDF